MELKGGMVVKMKSGFVGLTTMTENLGLLIGFINGNVLTKSELNFEDVEAVFNIETREQILGENLEDEKLELVYRAKRKITSMEELEALLKENDIDVDIQL